VEWGGVGGVGVGVVLRILKGAQAITGPPLSTGNTHPERTDKHLFRTQRA